MFIPFSTSLSPSANMKWNKKFELVCQSFKLCSSSSRMNLKLLRLFACLRSRFPLCPLLRPSILPLYLLALIRLRPQCPERWGGERNDCREMREVGRQSEAKRDRGEEEEWKWKERREGHRCFGKDAAVNNNISESQHTVCGQSRERDRKRSIDRITHTRLALVKGVL